MSKAIIDFEKGDISALKEIASILQAIIDKEGAVGEAWKQTTVDMTAQTKTNTDSTNKLAQSIDQMAVASKSMDKVVIGGAYANYLKQIQVQLGLTQNELISYVQNARKAAQAEILNPANSKETIDQLTLSVQVMNDQLRQFGVLADSSGQKSNNFTTQIRNVRNEILAMTEAGQSGTAEFAALESKYTEMQRISKQFRIQSTGLVQNNEAIAGTISLLSGVTGAFQIATSATILFGDANSDVQKAMQKLFAAMNLLQGLQQIEAVIQKSSAASILLNSISRKANTAAIVENNVAQGSDIAMSEADSAAKVLQIGATEGATVATEALNAALLDNPITAIIVGISALVVAYSTLSDNSSAVAAMQDNFNQSLEESGKIVDEDIAIFDKYIQQQVAIAKSLGASTAEQIALEGNLNNQKLNNIKKEADAATVAYNKQTDEINQLVALDIEVDKNVLKSHDDLLKNKEKLDKEYTDLYQQQLLRRQQLEQQVNADNIASYNAYVQLQVAAQIAGTDAERNAQISVIREIAAVRESDVNFQSKTAGEKALIRADDEKKIQALELQNYQHFLKGKTAAIDAELAIEKAHQATSDADAIASINKITDLQIAAIKKQRDEQLANPTLNNGEQQKIIADANLAIVEAEKKKQADILSIQEKTITDQLAAAQKGSYEEYVYDLSLLKIKEDKELVAAGKNQDAINAIKDKYAKLGIDRDTAFNVVQLNNEVSRDDTALARFGITEQEKLALTLIRLNDEKAIEIAHANGNAAKILEINAKYDQQRINAIKASIDAELALNIKALDTFNEIGKQKNNAIIGDPLADPVAKQIANDTLLREEQFKTDLEIDALEKQKLLLSTEDYAIKLQAIENEEDANKLKHSQTAIQIFKDEQTKKLSILQQTISVFQNSLNALDTGGLQTGLQNALNAFGQIAKAVSDYKIALQDPNADQAAAKQAEAEAIKTASIIAIQNTLNQMFADSAAQRQQELTDNISALENQKNVELNNANLTAKQKSAINAKYAAEEKQVKLAAWKADQNAKESQIVIEGALNVVKAFPNPVLMALAAGLTFVELGVVATQKPPKFKHGVIDLQGHGTSTSDSIPAFLSKGESVIPAEPTSKWKDALIAIKDNQFEDYLGQKFKSFVFPHIPDNVPIPTGKPQEIDYKLLAKEMAKEMKGIIPAPKSMHFNIDKNGIHTIVEEGNTRTEWKNKRYSMNG